MKDILVHLLLSLVNFLLKRNPFRQRISRLVRSSLSFSKKLDNHVGAIWYFIHNYNLQLAMR